MAPDQRGAFRIGVVITGSFVVAVLVTIAGGALPPPDAWPTLAAAAALAATGVGLLLRARFARVLAGLLFLACGMLAPISLIQGLAAARFGDMDPGQLLAAANAVATLVLGVWLCGRAILVLLGRPPRASVITARLAGATLLIVAANHLWLAHTTVDAPWAWSITISPRGTQFIGFPGWLLWHLVALIPALVLLVGPRTLLAGAAAALMVLFASMVPLALLGAARTGLMAPEWIVFLFGLTLLPVYLCWWLRDELHRLARPPRAA